jgi:hypothetical protein
MGVTSPKYLSIRLEGPFSVVIKNQNAYQIRVCTPRDPDHLFAVNGTQIQYKPGDSFHFALKPDGLATYNGWPDIDPAFDWSNKTTSKWIDDGSNYFITMDVPCPQQIRQDGTARVTFDNNQTAVMPLDHILIYGIKDMQKVQITCKELGSQTIDQNGVFQLELGLPQGTSSGTVHDHAIMFYNNMLKAFFPDLYNKADCRLKDIVVKTTTLECKNGGLIVGFP